MNILPRSFRSLLLPGVIGFVFVSLAIPEQTVTATSDVWSPAPGTTADFSVGSNWSTGTAPSGTSAQPIFSTAPGTGTGQVAQPNLSVSMTEQGLSFTIGGYTLSNTNGAVLSLSSALNSGVTAISTTNSTGTNTISAPISLVSGAGTNQNFVQAPGGTLSITGSISNLNALGSLSLTESASGSATFIFSGNNTYSANTVLNKSNVTLDINSATAIGTGALVVGSNLSVAIDNTTGSAITLTNNNGLTFNGTSSLTFTGTSSLNFGTGAVTLGAPGNAITVTKANTLTLGGAIGDGGGGFGITKAGVGILTLSSTGSTYTGATTVSAGILNMTGTNATSATTINSGGTLSGTGTVGALTLNSGGLISPGAVAGGTAANLKASSLTWNTATTASGLAFNIGGTSMTTTSLTLSGALTLGTSASTFNVTLTSDGTAATVGTVYDLVNFTSTNATSASQFNLINQTGDSGSLVLTSGQLDFDVTAVPEPSTAVMCTMMLTAVAGSMLWRRSRAERA